MSRWGALCAQNKPARPLPGAEIERFPYISGYGLALRITRLAALGPTDLGNELGVRGGAQADLFASTRRAGRWQSAFADHLGLSGSDLLHLWNEKAWSPLQLHGCFDQPAPRHLRHCPACVRFGYHTMAFQMPSIAECPWHGEPLQGCCRSCGTPYEGTFGPDGSLGVCRCGHDLLDIESAATRMWQFPTNEASYWLEAYLAWAESERHFRHLIVRPDASLREWAPAYAAFALPPQGLIKPVDASSICEVQIYASERLSEPPVGHFWGWSMLSDDGRQLPFLALPATVGSSLEAATERVLASLPRSHATPMVLVRNTEFGFEQPLNRQVAKRPNCFIAPFGGSHSGTAWFDVSAVDPRALSVCERLVQIIAETFGALSVTTERSWQAARSEAIDGVLGRQALDDALQALLIQAYEQGLEAVLLADLGSPWPASRPWWEPVVEVRGHGQVVESIRIAWAKSPPPQLRMRHPTDPMGSRPARPDRRKPVERIRGSVSKSPAARRDRSQLWRARNKG